MIKLQHLNSIKQFYFFFIKHILNLNAVDEFYSQLNGGLRIQTYSRLPVGSGLGVSSLLLGSILKALSGLFDIILTPQTLFASIVYLENVTGVGGGWEDGTAIYPGFKLMESFPERPFSPLIKKLSINDTNIKKLNEHLLLIYTGIHKQSQLSFESIVERYCLKETDTLLAIERNNSLNNKLTEYLVKGDLEKVGKLMQSQWENWKILTKGECTNSKIDDLFIKVAPYIYGGRINGAGQGGCAMLIAKENKKGELVNLIQTVLGESASIYKWNPIL